MAADNILDLRSILLCIFINFCNEYVSVDAKILAVLTNVERVLTWKDMLARGESHILNLYVAILERQSYSWKGNNSRSKIIEPLRFFRATALDR